MKKYMIFLMMALAVSVFALDGIDTWANKIWGQALPPEQDSLSTVLTQVGPGKYKTTQVLTSYHLNPDGSYSRDYSGPDEISHAEFQNNGTLMSSSSQITKDKKSYTVTLSADRKLATFRTELAGKVPSTKSLSLKPNNIIMSEYLNLVRQAWQIGIRGGFGFKGMSPGGTMEIDMEIRLIETSIPWNINTSYNFPVEFKAAFPDTQTYVIADFNLAGLFSIMYGFHNYTIFKLTPTGLQYQGSFGGDPKSSIFTYISGEK